MKTFNASLTTFCVLYFVPVFKTSRRLLHEFVTFVFFAGLLKTLLTSLL